MISFLKYFDWKRKEKGLKEQELAELNGFQCLTVL